METTDSRLLSRMDKQESQRQSAFLPRISRSLSMMFSITAMLA